MLKGSTALPFLVLLISLSSFAAASSDTLKPSESLAFNQTLVSAGGKYELGFFPTASDKVYLGIWYYNLPVTTTYVWVANRDSPARNSAVSLKFATGAQIVLAAQDGSAPVWASNQSAASNPVLQLLDSGNLVVREADDTNPDNYIWQSFDYPTDTLLPGQKLGWDKKSGLNRYITSWRSNGDPSSGNYSFRLNDSGDPEAYLLRGGTQRIYRSGPWVGLRFSGVPEMKPSTDLNFTFQDSPDAVYYMFDLVNPSIKSRLVVDPTGLLNRFTWVADAQTWTVFWYARKDQCDTYDECGPYGVCNAGNLFVCGCPQGFEPRNPTAWGLRDGSGGCSRRTRLDCGTDGFVLLKDMKLPESGGAAVYKGKQLEECAEICRKQCNCTAYANWEVEYGKGTGCVTWTGDLMDMRTYSEGGQDLYIRVAAADLVSSVTANDSNKTKKVIIGVTAGAVVLLLAIAGCFAWKRKCISSAKTDERVSRPGTTERSQDFLLSGTMISSKRDLSMDNSTDDLELPLYDFDAMVAATNNFSDENKLGQGGFGRVYKGVFGEGEEVAIKRLSKESGQGVGEFKNEVKLIAKLQHRNLVRLLGCCVERDEKMLIYEYLPNRSLDSVLFHREKCSLLDWRMRFNIICGIARGLLYLHHDSRLRIIHRDLKASNILLDRDMSPKISDFGMARIFGGDETESNNTRRVVGTYGYMSPEYAMDGLFSIKSDVFSFGVLVLEIVTGKKNRGFYNSEHELNLLAYAWKMWKEGKGTELRDPSIGDSYSVHEVIRCIQVGLLCVQERPEERPTMSTVVLLLSSETASLPHPKLPGFCLGWRPGETNSSSGRQDESCTVNQVTVTVIDGR